MCAVISCCPQIEPREIEIGEMKETIRAMDSELERYHKSNAGLDLTIQVDVIGIIWFGLGYDQDREAANRLM
jgi:hypothetical protein